MKNMWIMYNVFVTVLVRISINNVVALRDVDGMFGVLGVRLEELEKNAIANKHEITSLRNKISDMEMEFEDKQNRLSEEVTVLKARLADYEDFQLKDTTNHVEDVNKDNLQTMSKKRSRLARGQVETEVAFYATHSEHDVIHLGANEILRFEQAVTNKGNAYSATNGTFTAPVSGTYVFHVTIMGGAVHNVTNYHYSAMIDVNGVKYSKMWVTMHDQSSQMLVIDLETGGVVTIRNVYNNEGFVGQHYSTFSGFLLYEKTESAAAIIGK